MPHQKESLAKYGFTLVELLIVVILIGILTSISIASLSGYTRRQTVTQAAKNLEADLRAAKNRAVSGVEGQLWGIHFDWGTDNQAYTIFSTPSFAYSAGTTEIRKELSANVTITNGQPAFGAGSNILNIVFNRLNGEAGFYNDGGSTTDPPPPFGRITLSLPGVPDQTVTVELGGQIYGD